MLSTTEKHANMISTINHAQISFFTKKIIFFILPRVGKSCLITRKWEKYKLFKIPSLKYKIKFIIFYF